MGKRLTSTFYSEKGQDYTIEIYDDQYSSTVIEFDTINANLKYDAGGNDDNRFEPIISSELTVDVFVNTNDLNQFVEDLIVSPEDRFYIILKATDSNDNLQFRWIGYILSDLISIEDIATDLGYNFQIKAKDGLNRLKNFDYNNSGSVYTGKQTLLGHILNCLLKIDFALIEYISVNDYILNYATNWVSGQGGNQNTLTSARVSHRAFYHVDSKGNFIYKSCYDVLSEICKILGARIMSSGKGFYLTQINQYANANSITEYKYNVLTTGIVSSTVDYSIEHNQADADNTEVYRLAGGQFSFLAPLQYARVDYQHIATRNLWQGQELNSSLQTPVIIEDIDSGNQSATIQFDFKLEYKSEWVDTLSNIDPTPRVNHFIVYKATVKVGNYYWVNNYQQELFSVTFTNAEWTTDSGFFYFATDIIDADSQYFYKNYEILAPNVPEDGDLTINIQIEKVRSAGQDVNFIYNGQSTSDTVYVDITYDVSAIYLQNIVLGTFTNQNDINRYQSNNDNIASKTIEVVTFIGDGPNINSPGHIEVNDGSEWVLSEDWTIGGSGTPKNISQLLANEIVKGQLTPVKKFASMPFMQNDTKTSFLQPHFAISYDSAYWVLMQGQINFAIDQFVGDWFKVQSGSGFTEQTVVFLDKDYENISSSGSVGQSGSIGGGSVIGGGGENSGSVTSNSNEGAFASIFQEVFIADGTQNSFTVTENEGKLPDNTNDLMITRNGLWVNSNYINSLSGSTGTVELTFTPDAGDRIVIIWVDRGDNKAVIFQEVKQGDGVNAEFEITKNDGFLPQSITQLFIMQNGLFIDYKRITDYKPNQGKITLNYIPEADDSLAFVWFKEVPIHLVILQEVLVADGTNNVFNLASNGGNLPKTKDAILVLRNGQHINNDYIDGYNFVTGSVTLSFVPDQGDEITFVLFYTELVYLPKGPQLYQEQFVTDGVSNTLIVTKNQGKLPNSLDAIMIYRNGQFISNGFVQSHNADTGEIIFSFTPRANEKFTIVWVISTV